MVGGEARIERSEATRRCALPRLRGHTKFSPRPSVVPTMVPQCAAALLLSPCLVAQPSVFERLRDVGSPPKILIVDGQTITPGWAERRAVHLFCPDLVRDRVFARMLADERARRGDDAPVLDEEACARAGDVAAQRFESRFPTASEELVERIRLASGTSELLLDELFLTDDANGKWPEVTLEILRTQCAGADGEQLLTNVQNTRPLPEFWMQLLRGWLHKGIMRRANIEWPWDGLPAPICMRAAGSDWSTVQLWRELALQPQQLRIASALLVIEIALEQELRDMGAELSDEEFDRRYAGAAPDSIGFPGLPISPSPAGDRLGSLAFTTTFANGVFQRLWRQRLAHEAHVEDELTEEELVASAAALRKRVVAVDLITFTARDLATGAWREDPTAARTRAARCAKSLRAGTPFDEARDEDGEWFTGDERIGIFERCNSVEVLRTYLGENEVTDLVFGPSAAEEIFLRASIDSIVGPLPTPTGAVIARVRARRFSGDPIAKDHSRVREHAMWTRFSGWAREVVESARIEVR